MKYVYPPNAGEGVVVYVIDSGVNIHHQEFEGRAKWGKTFLASEGHRDLHGHGTHVSGTIASRKYGVAKKAEIISVKVLNRLNKGNMATFIAGLQWVEGDASLRAQGAGHKGTVINMSLGGANSRAMDDAANKAVRAGFHVVVAAGNEHKDACRHSPASSSLPITVGSTTRFDKLAASSNHGRCVDILAPGDKILSAGNTGSSTSRVLSGTSMATPHVAGLIAQFLSLYPSRVFNPYSAGAYGPFSDTLPQPFSGDMDGVHSMDRVVTPLVMKRALKEMAWSGVIASLPANTPNQLVFNNYTANQRFNMWDEDEELFQYY